MFYELTIELLLCSVVARILGHALEDSQSKSSLIYSLSVCISLLDPRRSAGPSPLFHSFRGQHMYEPPVLINPETVGAMLQKLGSNKFIFLLCYSLLPRVHMFIFSFELE